MSWGPLARGAALGLPVALGIALAIFLGGAPARAAFDDEPLTYNLQGYWKVRGLWVKDLFLGQADASDVGASVLDTPWGRLRGLSEHSYLLHQMRLSPSIAYRKIATLHADVDLLDGVVWGDNEGRASLPLFAGNPTNTGDEGQGLDALALRRLWLELNLPVGQLRVGRMPSQWGMGLLANAGDGLGADFGDFRAGSTVDRILFATRPVQIVQTVLGDERADRGLGSKLLLAVGYDKTVSLARTDDPHAELECRTCAPQILLARPNDDVDQFLGVLMYKDDDPNFFAPTDRLQAGVYVVHRAQRDTRSKVTIFDAYLRLRLWWLGLESELLYLGGTTEAIADGDNPKGIDIKGGVVRPGFYGLDWLDVELEVGWAPGDDEPTDAHFTGYPFHPDYNVGLLLYDYVLAARTARAWTRDSRGLWSKGGVWSSIYVQPKARWRVQWVDGLTVIAAFLWAKADTEANGLWAASTPPTDSDLELGYELDLAARYDFFAHMSFKLEAGVFIPGRALWKDVWPPSPGPPNAAIEDRTHDGRITEQDRAKPAWTVQGRLAFEL